MKFIPTFICVLLACVSPCAASVKSQAVKEAADYVLKKFGKEAAEQGLETLTRRIDNLALKYGDEALEAARKVGPRTFHIVEEAGEQGAEAVRLLARYGDEAAWIAAKNNRLALATRYGDDAAQALLKHGEIAEPVLESLGQPAAGALKVLSKQNGRRLAMLADDGALKSIGRTDELLAVVSRYGDRAMDFVWKNKGALVVAAALTAFLQNPEPFLDGARDLTRIAAEQVAAPLAAAAAHSANWTLVLSLVIITAGALVAWRIRPRQSRATAPSRTPPLCKGG